MGYLNSNHLHELIHLGIFEIVRFHFGPKHCHYHNKEHHTVLNIHMAISKHLKYYNLRFDILNIVDCKLFANLHTQHQSRKYLLKYSPMSKHLNHVQGIGN